MTHLSYPALALFLQAASPAETPVSAASAVIVAAAAAVGFLGGCLLTAIFLLAKRREKPTSSFENSIANADKGRINIKHCSQCDSTYTDAEIGYCLRDGMLLKVVGTMPVPLDPEKTHLINRNP